MEECGRFAKISTKICSIQGNVEDLLKKKSQQKYAQWKVSGKYSILVNI